MLERPKREAVYATICTRFHSVIAREPAIQLTLLNPSVGDLS